MPRKLPVLDQLSLVKTCPFEHKSEGSWREFAVNSARFDLDGDFVLAVNGMKMWDSMFAVKYPDYDSEKSRNFRH